MDNRQRPRIGIVGVGRAGGALCRALDAAGYRIGAVWSRTHARAAALAQEVGALATETPCDVALEADLIILAVSDDQITPVAARIARVCAAHDPGSRSVVHLSGTYGAAALQSLAEVGVTIGALHPLQTFADERSPVLPGTTFAIEAPEPLHTTLHELVVALGGHPLDLAASDRALYHAAAAITANYAVTLLAQAVALLEQCGVPPERGLQALVPLLRGAVDNLDRLGLPDALTGPIARGDAGTVRRHLEALAARAPEALALYQALGLATLPLAVQRGADPLALDQIETLLEQAQPAKGAAPVDAVGTAGLAKNIG